MIISNLPEYARLMRSHLTKTEAQMWEVLRDRRLDGHKFRRQQIIGSFIVDFVCQEKKLIIEIDGSIHQDKQQTLLDRERESFLTSQGYRIIRFTNEDVHEYYSWVIGKIREALLSG